MSTPLTPPDPARCQAEKPTGNGPFTLGGRVGRVRCDAEPTTIIRETVPGDDGECGSMSLCPSCLRVFKRQVGMEGHETISIADWNKKQAHRRKTMQRLTEPKDDA